MRGDLSVLCVTAGEPCVLPLLQRMRGMSEELGAEFVLVVDGDPALLKSVGLPVAATVKSAGFLESIYEEALTACHGRFIFRLDDDEVASPELVAWLRRKAYLTEWNWRFLRLHLWEHERQYVANPPLWPNYQTRLSLPELAGGRQRLHAPSPFGPGSIGEGTILHYKFLLRSRSEREAQARRYEGIRAGGGTGKFLAHLVPEAVFDPVVTLPC